VLDAQRESREDIREIKMEHGDWRLLAEASGNDAIAVAPFDALELGPSNLWS
jgi:hypothetical protein